MLSQEGEGEDLDKNHDDRAHAAVRWFAALIAVVYGFAKLNGSQFTILDSELDKPMGEVSGFWLTWYYPGAACEAPFSQRCVERKWRGPSGH